MTNKKEKLEDLEDKLKSITRKYLEKQNELYKLEKEMTETSEEMCEISPEYVKIICPQCSNSQLKGYVMSEDGKQKVKCPVCNSKKYIWARIYKGDENSSRKV